MGTIIESIGISSGHRGLFSPSALKLADEAITSCLSHTQRTADDLDVLINVGMYKEQSLGEPAFASMIQEELGAHRGHPKHRGPRDVVVRRLQRRLRHAQRRPADRRAAVIGNRLP